LRWGDLIDGRLAGESGLFVSYVTPQWNGFEFGISVGQPAEIFFAGVDAPRFTPRTHGLYWDAALRHESTIGRTSWPASATHSGREAGWRHRRRGVCHVEARAPTLYARPKAKLHEDEFALTGTPQRLGYSRSRRKIQPRAAAFKIVPTPFGGSSTAKGSARQKKG
jgi:hypothetical protein